MATAMDVWYIVKSFAFEKEPTCRFETWPNYKEWCPSVGLANRSKTALKKTLWLELDLQRNDFKLNQETWEIKNT